MYIKINTLTKNSIRKACSKMKHCILCGKPLTAQNRTVEHIFLSSFGDTLTNNSLICRECNSKLGDLVDSDIVKDFSPITKMAGIYGSNHGKKPTTVNISVIGDDGNPYLYNTINNSAILKHSIIRKHKLGPHQLSIDASLPAKNIDQGVKQFKRIVNKELKRYQKKHGKRPRLNGKEKVVEKSLKKLHVNITLHFKRYIFEILKMGTEFAISCGVDRKILMVNLILLHILIKYPTFKDNPFPIEKYRDMLFKMYFPVTYIPSDMKIIPGKMQAKLWIKNNQLLFWVSILGILQYIVPLASNVKGSGIAEYKGEGNAFYDSFKN